MHFGQLVPLSFMLWTMRNPGAEGSRSQGEGLLQDAMYALHKGLQYMEKHATELNLDGVFGCRLVEGLLDAFLESKPAVSGEMGGHLKVLLKMLSAKAGRLADEARDYVKLSQPGYYAAVGGLLDRSEVLLVYSSRLTKSSDVVQPVPCPESIFNTTYSDHCFNEIVISRGKETCNLSDGCLQFMTRPRLRGYMITHQVLYFQVMEMKNCLKRSRVKQIPKKFQDTLCSNVMRDAKEIAASGYPLGHRDLFLEQIGLCGLWGYKDFYKPNWLSEILQWQQASGCYANSAKWYCTENLSKQHVRIKREEKVLEDGCLSHKTTVALVAIAANIRFMVEELLELQ